jgi:hypothetical protein
MKVQYARPASAIRYFGHRVGPMIVRWDNCTRVRSSCLMSGTVRGSDEISLASAA